MAHAGPLDGEVARAERVDPATMLNWQRRSTPDILEKRPGVVPS
jgi:hypothetical protein